MTQMKPAAAKIFDDYGAAVRKCRRDLIEQEWFGGNWWINTSFDTNGYTFQLAKTNWFNHNGNGIHIEFWLEEHEAGTKEIDIVLHFEADVPDRKALGSRFKASFAPLACDFEDYRVNHNAICDKLQKRVAFTKSSLPRVAVAEFSRLQAVAPIIDRLLK